VEQPLIYAGVGMRQRRERAKAALESGGLGDRLKHHANELSGGQQQRVAIARALVTQPSLILADEPTGNLDSKNSEIVLAMLRHSNRELGQTVLMITHNPEAASYGDRIIHMRDGEIVAPEKDPQWTGHSA
jgi:putative ABC transport system ATP-binding protein